MLASFCGSKASRAWSGSCENAWSHQFRLLSRIGVRVPEKGPQMPKTVHFCCWKRRTAYRTGGWYGSGNRENEQATFKGDKQAATGHRTMAMVARYNRFRPVKPNR